MATAVPDNRRGVGVWLATIYLLILAMVAVGGITRLTDSGLSMVDWRPVTGVLPPLSPQAWQAEFARYQTSPEFQQVHHWMELSDFKRIFFWEYFHRLLGRILALVAFIPWLWFVIRGVLRDGWIWRTALIFGLGATQGALGWFMVKSGLVDVPAVSHFRLAAHLLLAFATAQWVLWLFLEWRAGGAERSKASPSDRQAPPAWWPLLAGTFVLVVVQVAYGAFVAGTDAGVLFATFPDMNGAVLPGIFFTRWTDAFIHPLSIHYLHRALACLLLLPLVALVIRSLGARPPVRRAVFTVAGLTTVQIILGALTVVWHVPIPVAVAHQCTGLFIVSGLVWAAFEAHRGGVFG